MFCTHSARARFLLSGRWVTRFPPRLVGRPPLDDIRDYLGEKAAFYFAFMHHYTRWLLHLAVPALIGLVLIFLPADEVCPEGWATYVNESAAFAAAPVGRPPLLVCALAGADHALVPFFGIFGALWAVYFFKYWRRYQSELVYRWDMADFAEEEPTRPEFYRHRATRHDRKGFYARKAGFMPFGDVYAPYFPGSARATRMYSGLACTLMLMLVIVIATLGIFALKLILAHSPAIAAAFGAADGATIAGVDYDAEAIAMTVAATLNTALIMLCNVGYSRLGVFLTDWENHRTESEYENSLIVKNAIFQSVNSYASLIYIAFVKPLHFNLFGIQGESPDGAAYPLYDMCSTRGCMRDLVTQMLVVVFVKQFYRNLSSSLVPWVLSLFRKRISTTAVDELSGVDKLVHEARLPPPRSLYWEFNEMAIQFGYVTMFAAAAPWAATLCLVNNAIERKADAMAMLYGRQRPQYVGAASIGAWSTVFEVLSFAAIVSNIAIVGVTSDALTDIYGLSPSGALWLCVLLEHAIVVLKFYVSVRVGDEPLWVLKAAAYQEWQVKNGEHDEAPVQHEIDALQAQYDDDDDLERFWL